MARASSIRCPNCSAPLSVSRDQLEITCSYCNQPASIHHTRMPFTPPVVISVSSGKKSGGGLVGVVIASAVLVALIAVVVGVVVAVTKTSTDLFENTLKSQLEQAGNTQAQAMQAMAEALAGADQALQVASRDVENTVGPDRSIQLKTNVRPSAANDAQAIAGETTARAVQAEAEPTRTSAEPNEDQARAGKGDRGGRRRTTVEIAKVIRARRAEIDDCPGAGRVELKLKIAASGRVTSASVSSRDADKATTSCVKDIVGRLVFPAASQSSSVTYPMFVR